MKYLTATTRTCDDDILYTNGKQRSAGTLEGNVDVHSEYTLVYLKIFPKAILRYIRVSING